jgi:phosphoadenosine phosphosulfate reductase
VIARFRPNFWLTALRKDETEFRRTLDVASKGPNGILKIAPFLDWTEVDMENYLYEHGLPQVSRYFDPTKGESTRECGLHTLDFSI